MSINHTWTIDKIEVLNDGSSTVNEVYFTLSSVDTSTGLRVETDSSVELKTEGIENFVDFNNLTESKVIEWVKNRLGPGCGGYVPAHVEKLKIMATPPAPATVEKDLPW